MAALAKNILNKIKKKPKGEGILTIQFLFEKMVKNLSLRLIHFIQLSNAKVTLKNGVLSTDLFVKPTDTHNFLDPASCHPYQCKKGIPQSQTL